MSILQYPDAMSTQNLRVWNNDAFVDISNDADESATKTSFIPLQPIVSNGSETLESESSKENRSPIAGKSPTPIKSQGKPLKLLFKQGLAPTISSDSDKIDDEIEEIEKKISRLSSRLEALKVERAGLESKTVEKRNGRIIPAKFMEPKQIPKTPAQKSIKESPANEKFRRRGVSMGPAEISAGVRFRQDSKQEITPIRSIQSRRKSCFFRLPEIEEEKDSKVNKERRRLSLSPKPRLSVTKISDPKRGLSTVGSKKPVKKDDLMLRSIQPQKLFQGPEKTAGLKKPAKSSRIVPSRYSQIPAGGNSPGKDRGKRSLPGNDKEESKRGEKKRSASVGKSRNFLPAADCSSIPVTENRVKKRWEIPPELKDEVRRSGDGNSPPSILEVAELLPKIRAVRFVNESPRDSGCAKRAVDLVCKKSFFSEDGEVGPSVCQALEFEKEEAELLPKIRALRCANESPRDSGCAKRVVDLVGKKSFFTSEDEVGSSVCQVLEFEKEQ